MISNTAPLYTYTINGKIFSVTAIKLLMSALMIAFALFEILPSLKNIKFKENKLYIGGIVSGFFGGLSGFQGALRSAFLLRYNLSKGSFIATGIFIACIIDLTRLSVYFTRFSNINIEDNMSVLIFAAFSSFAGAYIGNRLLKKVTFDFVQRIVTGMIILLAVGLGSGLL
jgi:uncharacterized membrane protein YfcA